MSEDTPDWLLARIFTVASTLLAGLTFDWRWFGCSFAWAIVAFGLLMWSLNEKEFRP